MFKIGYVYAILMSDGMVKIGRSSKSVSSRIKSHALTAKLRGASIQKTVESGKLMDSHAAEQFLRNLCLSSSADVIAREWFMGADFDEIADIFASRFNGDCEKQIALKEDEKLASLTSATGRMVKTIPHKDQQIDLKWIATMEQARLVRQCFINAGIEGELIERTISGVGDLHILLAIYLHDLEDKERINILAEALSYPVEFFHEFSDFIPELRSSIVARARKLL